MRLYHLLRYELLYITCYIFLFDFPGLQVTGFLYRVFDGVALWGCVIVIEPTSLGMRSGAAFFCSLCFSFTQFRWGPSSLQSPLSYARGFWFLRCFFGPSEGFVRPFVL